MVFLVPVKYTEEGLGLVVMWFSFMAIIWYADRFLEIVFALCMRVALIFLH